MVGRTILNFILIVSIPLCIYTSAVGENQEKEGKALDKSADSIQAAGEKKDAGAEKIDSSKEKNGVGPERANKNKIEQDDANKDKPALKAERKRKENKKKQQLKDEIPIIEEGVIRESPDDLLLIDNESIKYDRIPGITIKTEDRSEDKLVKIPDEKIAGKSREKKPKDGIFGLKTDTVARVGLLIVIFIIFILYKTRSKKSKRKVVRTVPKR